MIGNHRPTTMFSMYRAVVVFLSVDIMIVNAFHQHDVSAFTSVRRHVHSLSSSSSSSSSLHAATIDASELYHGSPFYAGGCASNDDDCLLFELGAVDVGGKRGSGGASNAVNGGGGGGGGAGGGGESKRAGTGRVGGVIVATTTTTPSSSSSSVTPTAASATRVASATTAAAVLLVTLLGGGIAPVTRRLSILSSWYLTRLDAFPLYTKCVTGGMIALVGDYGAQWFERSSRSRSSTSTRTIEEIRSDAGGGGRELASEPAFSLRAGCNVERNTSPTTSTRNDDKDDGRPPSIHGTYDVRRGMARFLECLLVSSPLMHVGYELFERVMPVVSSGPKIYRNLAALSHVVADSVFLDGIFVCTGIVATGLLEGRSLRRHVLPNLRNVYLPTLRASVVTSSALMPLQFLSFRFLPIQLRVLSVNAVDLIWTAVVSFVSHGGGGGGDDGGVVSGH
jgi:hypothetical protein